MNKPQVLNFARKWKYVFICPQYDFKLDKDVYSVNVPTTVPKSKSSYIRTKKLFQGDDINTLLEKTKTYFSSSTFYIKVVLKSDRMASVDEDKILLELNKLPIPDTEKIIF